MTKRIIAIIYQDPESLKNKVDEIICESDTAKRGSHRLYKDGLDIYSTTGITSYVFFRALPHDNHSCVEKFAGLRLQGLHLCEGNYSHNTVNYLLSRIRS